jgi:hypothetical protein
MRAVTELLNLLANGAHLFFGGRRFHDDKHNFSPLGNSNVGTAAPSISLRASSRPSVERSSTYSPRPQEKPHLKSIVARSAPQMQLGIPKQNPP